MNHFIICPSCLLECLMETGRADSWVKLHLVRACHKTMTRVWYVVKHTATIFHHIVRHKWRRSIPVLCGYQKWQPTPLITKEVLWFYNCCANNSENCLWYITILIIVIIIITIIINSNYCSETCNYFPVLSWES